MTRNRLADVIIPGARKLITTVLASSMFMSFAGAQSLIAPRPSSAVIIGRARAADGDSLVVEGTRIRLFGIDAPELSQTCTKEGQSWSCGEAAKQKLQGLVVGRDVICKPRSIDAFGREVATCAVGAQDVGDVMVRSGLATAFQEYSSIYVAAEEQAHSARAGIWAGEFRKPQDYRHQDAGQPLSRQQSARTTGFGTTATGACRIKGNHSRKGEWIYHLPGMPYYEGTRAEAMFCTEAEARAAGYRRSRADMHR